MIAHHFSFRLIMQLDLTQIDWKPTASIENLLKRAEIMRQIRQFFTDRGVLEVETPVLSEFSVTDIHLSTFSTQFLAPFASEAKTLHLMTSPEYHMKRLLAAGSGAIFSCAKSSVMKRLAIAIILNSRC